MVQATKKKKELDASMYSGDAVKILSGMGKFSDVQGTQVLNELKDVQVYLADKRYLKEDLHFGDNHGALLPLLEEIGGRAANNITSENADVNAKISEIANACVKEIHRLMKSDGERQLAFGGIVPAKVVTGADTAAHSAHKTPILPVVSVSGLASPTPEWKLNLSALPSSIATYLDPGEAGEFGAIDPNSEQGIVLKDIEDMLESMLNNNQAGAAAAGEQFWQHLNEFASPGAAEAMICGTGAGSSECTNLINQLREGNFDALVNGEYPIAEALLEDAMSRNRIQWIKDIIITGEVEAKAALVVSENGEVYLKGRLLAVVTETYTETADMTGEISTDRKRDYSLAGDLRLGAEFALPRDRGAIRAETGVSLTKPWWTSEQGVVFGIPVGLGLTLKSGLSEGIGLVADVSVDANFGKFPIAGAKEKFIEVKEEADFSLSLFQLEIAPSEAGDVPNYIQFLLFGSVAGMHLTADGFNQTLHNVPMTAGIGTVIEFNSAGERSETEFSSPGDSVATTGTLFLGAGPTYEAMTGRWGGQLNLQLGTDAVAGTASFAISEPREIIPDSKPEIHFNLGITGRFGAGGE